MRANRAIQLTPGAAARAPESLLREPLAWGIFVGATAIALLTAVSNTAFHTWANRVLPTDDPLVAGGIFSSYLVVVAAVVGMVVWRDPRRFGVQLGGTLRHWRRVSVVTFGFAALAWVALLFTASTPFSGADLVVEGVFVPISEELFFRGVLFGLVWLVMLRAFPGRDVTAAVVVISGLAFGIGHFNNLVAYEAGFVMLQVVYACCMGLAGGYLRAVTASVLPAVLLHSVANVLAVLV